MKTNHKSKPIPMSKRYRNIEFVDLYNPLLYSDSSDDYIDKLKAKVSRYKNNIRP